MFFYLERRWESYALFFVSPPYRQLHIEIPMVLAGLRIPFRHDPMSYAFRIRHADVPALRAAFVALGFTEKEAF